MKPLLHMKHPRHRLDARNYQGQRAYFLTICTAERNKYFANAELCEALEAVLHQQFERYGAIVGSYCFMPDHCHVLVIATEDSCDLGKMVRAFKGVGVAVARRFAIQTLWQRDYYDHIVRRNEDLSVVASYILQNPVRAGLVKDCREWPFSDCVIFPWRREQLADSFTPPWKKTGNKTGAGTGRPSKPATAAG